MSCLGDPSRFELVRRLARGQLCVSDLAREVGLSQSCTTRHLQALRRERLVIGERDGKRVLFRLSLEEPQAAALLTWVMSGRAAKPGRSKARSRPQRPDADPVPPSTRSEAEDPGVATAVSRDPEVAAAGARADGRDAGEALALAAAAEPARPPSRPRRGEIEDFLL